MSSQFFQSLEPRMFLSAGALDPSFGDHGIDRIGPPGILETQTIAAVNQGSDGKTILAAYVDEPSGRQAVLARLYSTGYPDPSFGGNSDGMSVQSFPGYRDFQTSAIELSGSNILIGGTLSDPNKPSRMGLIQLDQNGLLDTSFGNGGFVLVDSTDAASLGALALTRDGRILIGGSISPKQSFFLARLTSDGNLDRTFGSGGEVVTPFSDHPIQGIGGIRALAVMRRGAIIAAGGDDALDLARYNNDGSLDKTFHRTGKFGVRLYSGRLNAVAVRDDGEIFATGGVFVGQQRQRRPRALIALAVNRAGILDQRFGDHGIARVYIQSTSHAASQSDGNAIQLIDPDTLMVAGSFVSAYGAGPALLILDNAGRLDPAFGQGGVAVSGTHASNSQPDFARGLLVQEDGSVIVSFAGSLSATQPDELRALRYSDIGVVDSSYGYPYDSSVPGASIAPTFLESASVYSIAAGPDGSILRLFGSSAPGTLGGPGLVARLAPSGSPEPFSSPQAFGDGTIPVPAALNQLIAVQADGKFLVSDYDKLIRYDADGTVDTGFGSNGTATLGIPEVYRLAFPMSIFAQSDGSIVEAIDVTLPSNPEQPSSADYLLRLDSSGRTINSGLIARRPTDADGAIADDVVQAPDGKFVVSATTEVPAPIYDPTHYSILLERFNADFSIDNSFGFAGSITLHPGPITAGVVAAMPDGHVYVHGTTLTGGSFLARVAPDGTYSFALPVLGPILGEGDGKLITAEGSEYNDGITLTRLNADGSTDTTFGNGGQSFVGLRITLGHILLVNTSAGVKLLLEGPSDVTGSSDVPLVKDTRYYVARVDL